MARLSQNYLGLILLGALVLCQSCQPEILTQQDDGAYYPIQPGRHWIYEVSEERYSLTEEPIFSSYFLKEAIGEWLPSVDGAKTYKLIRYKRNLLSEPWKVDSAWAIQQWPDKLIRTENGIVYQKLTFPIATNSVWNQNEYNSLPTDKYEYEQIGKSYNQGTTTYPNTIQVVNTRNDSTAISLSKQVAVYAYKTGLIFRETAALSYCQSSPDCIGKEQIAYGFRQKMALLEEGKD
ncbi:hypothetical protein GCM10028805_34670 [Spirosoma harenae]